MDVSHTQGTVRQGEVWEEVSHRIRLLAVRVIHVGRCSIAASVSLENSAHVRQSQQEMRGCGGMQAKGSHTVEDGCSPIIQYNIIS